MTDLREHRTQAIVKQSLFHADAHAVTEVPGYRGAPNGSLSHSLNASSKRKLPGFISTNDFTAAPDPAVVSAQESACPLYT